MNKVFFITNTCLNRPNKSDSKIFHVYAFLDIAVSLFYEALSLENNGIRDTYKEIPGYCSTMLPFCLRKNETGSLVNREVVKSEVNSCSCIFLSNRELSLSLPNTITSSDHTMGYLEVVESMAHVNKLLQFENWNPTENHSTRNTSNAIK